MDEHEKTVVVSTVPRFFKNMLLYFLGAAVIYVVMRGADLPHAHVFASAYFIIRTGWKLIKYSRYKWKRRRVYTGALSY